MGFVAQVYRYRRVSSPAQRQQTKWVIAGVGAAVTGLLLFLVIVPALVPAVNQPGALRLIYVLVGVPLLFLSLLSFPLALVWSIFRFRLWNMDLLVNRTLVYILLSAILAGLFAAFETLAKSFFVTLTGQASEFSVVLSTLVVAAAFTPIKSALDTLVNKRFKEKGDPAIPLARFADHVQKRVSSVRPQQITQRLLDEVVQAFEAKGGRALLGGEGALKLVFVSGNWNDDPVITIPYCTELAEFGEVALAARTNGLAYTDEDRALLERVATTVAHAIIEDQSNAM